MSKTACLKGKKYRALVELIERVTDDYSIGIRRSNHIEVVLRRGGSSRKVFVAKTTSDHRACMNMLRDFRKAQAQLVEENPNAV